MMNLNRQTEKININNNIKQILSKENDSSSPDDKSTLFYNLKKISSFANMQKDELVSVVLEAPLSMASIILGIANSNITFAEVGGILLLCSAITTTKMVLDNKKQKEYLDKAYDIYYNKSDKEPLEDKETTKYFINNYAENEMSW